MNARQLTLPLFIIWLFLVNFRANLKLLLCPIFKQRFFCLTLILVVFYLVFLAKYLNTTPPAIIKPLDLSSSGNKIVIYNQADLAKIEQKLHELEFVGANSTTTLVNLALLSHYRNQINTFNSYWHQAQWQSPNHPLFQ